MPQVGHMFEYQDLIFWAESGWVQIVDRRDGSHTACSPDDWASRADSVGHEAARCKFPRERKAMEDLANVMLRVSKDAVAQGNPSDPRVMAYKMRHRSHSGNWVAVPGTASGQRRIVPGRA